MHHPFKSTLIHRLFWIFLGLSLVPTLLFVIVPSLLRIHGEQETLRQLQNDLSEKAVTTFDLIVSNKTENFEQVLHFRENMLWPLAETLAPHLVDLATTGHSDLVLVTQHQFFEQIVQTDSAIRRLYVIGSGLQWTVPEDEDTTALTPVQLEAMLTQFNTLQPEVALAETRDMDGVSILTIGVPIKHDGQIIGLIAAVS